MARPDRCLIAASILDSDLAKLGDEIRRAADGGADRIHIDIMDAHFVPNLTFGWKTVEAVRRVTTLPFDAHLMISEPSRWAMKFVEAGCESVTFHVEAEPGATGGVLEAIRATGAAAGLSVKPATAVSALEPFRALLDIVLVMTVEPGFGGQAFKADVARTKLRAARAYLDPGGACEVHVDGGGKRQTADVIGREGTDVIVVGSALYHARDLAAEVAAVRATADAARAEGERALAGQA